MKPLTLSPLSNSRNRFNGSGAPPERPATIIERATLPGQRLIGGRLDDIGARAQAAHVQAPALLIVGEAATSAAWVSQVLQHHRTADNRSI